MAGYRSVGYRLLGICRGGLERCGCRRARRRAGGCSGSDAGARYQIELANVVLGAWLIISPFILGQGAAAGAALWRDLILGVAIVFLEWLSVMSARIGAT